MISQNGKDAFTKTMGYSNRVELNIEQMYQSMRTVATTTQ